MKSRYALRSLVNLASRETRGPVSLSQIAVEEDISLNFLEQIFMALRKGKIVKSIRGPSGGYSLNRPAEEISLGQIMTAVGESIYPVKCVDEYFSKGYGSCPREKNCRAKNAWRELGRNMHQYLYRMTLSQLLGRKS